MPYEDLITTDFLQVFTLIFVRLGILAFALPTVLTQVFPLRFRFSMVAVLSLLIVFPKQNLLAAGMNIGFSVALFQELLLGLAIALMVSCLFFAFQMAGQLVSQLTGGNLVHPTVASAGSGTPLGTFFMLLALVIFLLSGSHRSVVDVLLNSITDFPPGLGWKIENSITFLVEILDFSFRVAVRIAAPIVACLIGTTLVMSLLAKLISYFGFFTVGLSINALVLLLVLLFSVAAIVHLTGNFCGEAIAMLASFFTQ